MKLLKKAVIVVSLLSLLVACNAETPASQKSLAGEETTSSQSPSKAAERSSSKSSLEDVHRIRVSEQNHDLRLSHSKILAGNVQFILDLPAREQHEILLVKKEKNIDELPIKNGKLDETDPSVETIALWTVRELKENERYREVVDLSPGQYVILYSEPGHLEDAIKAHLTVEKN